VRRGARQVRKIDSNKMSDENQIVVVETPYVHPQNVPVAIGSTRQIILGPSIDLALDKTK